MDVKGARSLIYELLGGFYSKASVKHSKQPNTVKSKPPLVTLTTISVKRPLNPPQKVIDGIMVSYYPTRMALQIDLCTKGAPVGAGRQLHAGAAEKRVGCEGKPECA